MPLERQPALVLIRLVQDAGLLVSRDSLRRAVWPADTHVDYDRGLNYCLRQLRLALGDDARAPRFIQTVPRQGYRFIETVTVTQATGAEPANAGRKSVAMKAAAVIIAALALTYGIERGPRHEMHHAAALALGRTVHDWLF